ncbi:MAG: hypothetical protein HY901_31390, partial [Deltaproteobacteria bacterium]|nr:hypothetical protein [Deltaproteobacteria bacterium]
MEHPGLASSDKANRMFEFFSRYAGQLARSWPPTEKAPRAPEGKGHPGEPADAGQGLDRQELVQEFVQGLTRL